MFSSEVGRFLKHSAHTLWYADRSAETALYRGRSGTRFNRRHGSHTTQLTSSCELYLIADRLLLDLLGRRSNRARRGIRTTRRTHLSSIIRSIRRRAHKATESTKNDIGIRLMLW
jgi:hypothetical protein